jgi:carbonic anhydrase
MGWNTRLVPQSPRNPDEALSALMEGNSRHQQGKQELRDYSPAGGDRAIRQAPFAAIISCADSRVSPTLIFDVDRGNIFSSKVAGNIIDSGTLGSTEFAVKVLGVNLVMVLGHSDCGAVKAALGVVQGTSRYPAEEFGAIGEVVGKVVPPVQGVPPEDRTLSHSISVNARAQADDIASRGPIVSQAFANSEIAVVAAVYDIASGMVALI